MVQAVLPFLMPAAPGHEVHGDACPMARAQAAAAADATRALVAQAAQAAAAEASGGRIEQEESAGFQIDWDHARHGLTPPLHHLQAASPVRQGWSAGRAAFGHRIRRATPAHRQWLALRLGAWQRREALEEVQVTPHLLSRIAVSHCPVTRMALLAADAQPGRPGPDSAAFTATTAASAEPTDEASVQRLNAGAAWAAGNLAMTGRQVARARHADGQPLDVAAMVQRAQALAEGPDGQACVHGLNAAEWMRLAVLASFGTPMPHAQAAAMPLLVLPPNRVRVINPVQALQVALTLQFTQGGYARRLLTLAALMPQGEVRQAFQIFMHTLLARRLGAGRDCSPAAVRRALEDAWTDPLVQRRWQRLALRLSAADCERLLERADRRQLLVGASRWMPTDLAVDGWAMGAAA